MKCKFCGYPDQSYVNKLEEEIKLLKKEIQRLKDEHNKNKPLSYF